MKLTEKEIEASDLSPDIKADILELFGMVKKKEDELATIRAKLPTDSQKVVEGVDHDKFIEATKELEKLKLEMQQKLQSQPSVENDTFLSAFRGFFS